MAKDLYNSDATTLYRIGEFAKYLGVTPDFLKHYESLGIIHSIQGENGYRYFRFQESNRIFECMKLKNLGFTIRESNEIINELNEDEIIERAGNNIELIRKEITFKQLLLDTYSEFQSEMHFLEYADSDWEIQNTEAMLFLPHTQSRSFIKDPEIYEILPEWMRALPVVRSAALIKPEHPTDEKLPSSAIERTWGLVCLKRFAEALNLPVNDAVIELPRSKALHYKFSARIPADGDRPKNYYTLWRKLDELHLSPGKRILAINNMGAHNDGILSINQHYIVPLE